MRKPQDNGNPEREKEPINEPEDAVRAGELEDGAKREDGTELSDQDYYPVPESIEDGLARVRGEQKVPEAQPVNHGHSF